MPETLRTPAVPIPREIPACFVAAAAWARTTAIALIPRETPDAVVRIEARAGPVRIARTAGLQTRKIAVSDANGRTATARPLAALNTIFRKKPARREIAAALFKPAAAAQKSAA